MIRVFDNKGKTFDRYTVVIYEEDNGTDPQYGSVFGMSSNADSPNGFNQYNGSVAELPAILDVLFGGKDKNIGHEVQIADLPEEVRIAIGKRLKQ